MIIEYTDVLLAVVSFEGARGALPVPPEIRRERASYWSKWEKKSDRRIKNCHTRKSARMNWMDWSRTERLGDIT